MVSHIVSVRQAVKFALSDFKGKELPGFSIPKKVFLCVFLDSKDICSVSYILNFYYNSTIHAPEGIKK